MSAKKNTISRKHLLYTVRDEHIAIIVLDKIERCNAQDTDLIYAVNEALECAAADNAIKVIIIRANGEHFSSGHDLSEENPYSAQAQYKALGTWLDNSGRGIESQFAREKELYLDMCERWRNIPKPMIAEVQGACISGGLLLAWPCDIIVAAEDAFFQDNTLLMGVGGVEYFAHLEEMGHRYAREALYTAEPINAEKALRLGMINHVVPNHELSDFTLALANKISDKSLFALKLAKEAINTAQDARGRRQALQTAFALHQLAHSNNLKLHDLLIDPSKLKPGIIAKNHSAISGRSTPDKE